MKINRGKEATYMIIVFIRALILYILVLVVVRMMGKRNVGELQPYELVITIMLADFAASPIEDTGIPLVNGIIPIISLLFLETAISVLMLKSESARKIIDGVPSIIMDKGRISYNELKKQRININDLLEQLRIQGYFHLHELEYIMIEPDGQLSIIPKVENRPLTLKDMNIKGIQDSIAYNLIMDGKRNRKNIEKSNCSEQWLNNELNKQGVQNDNEILLAYIDNQKNLYIYKKHKEE